MLLRLLAPATALIALALAGCVVSAPVAPPASQAGNKQPIISMVEFSPKTGVGKNDVVVFSTVATDPDGQALQYTWTATKGTLVGTVGQSVAWKPVKPDGSVEPGLATISVVVSDVLMTSTALVNVTIDASGQSTIQTPIIPPVATTQVAGQLPSAPVPSVTPTSPVLQAPLPTAGPTMAPPNPAITIDPGFVGRWKFFSPGGYSMPVDGHLGAPAPSADFGIVTIRANGTYRWELGDKAVEGTLQERRPTMFDDIHRDYYYLKDQFGNEHLISWDAGTSRVMRHDLIGTALTAGERL
jgi:hypothetical protein